ncbi:MAG TPA: hypothetical protein VJN18_31950 [Polyangiaceae bacterium]|nr:hypothetical protein [Polyangiaceae bacterium]
MRLTRFAGVVCGAALLAGCPAVSNDPPPPLSKPEIVPAPPRALGAMAAGTDAAPQPDRTPSSESMPLPTSPHGGPPVPLPHAPSPDAGAPGSGAPGSGPGGLAPVPSDAGMAL